MKSKHQLLHEQIRFLSKSLSLLQHMPKTADVQKQIEDTRKKIAVLQKERDRERMRAREAWKRKMAQRVEPVVW